MCRREVGVQAEESVEAEAVFGLPGAAREKLYGAVRDEEHGGSDAAVQPAHALLGHHAAHGIEKAGVVISLGHGQEAGRQLLLLLLR